MRIPPSEGPAPRSADGASRPRPKPPHAAGAEGPSVLPYDLEDRFAHDPAIHLNIAQAAGYPDEALRPIHDETAPRFVRVRANDGEVSLFGVFANKILWSAKEFCR